MGISAQLANYESFENHGEVEILKVDGTPPLLNAQTGVLTIKENGTLSAEGEMQNAGILRVDANGEMTLLGDIQNGGLFENAGTVTIESLFKNSYTGVGVTKGRYMGGDGTLTTATGNGANIIVSDLGLQFVTETAESPIMSPNTNALVSAAYTPDGQTDAIGYLHETSLQALMTTAGSGARLVPSAPLSLATNSTLNLSGVILDLGSENLTVSNDLTISGGGSITSSGTVTLTVANGGHFTLENATLSNTATGGTVVVVEGSGNLEATGGVISKEATGGGYAIRYDSTVTGTNLTLTIPGVLIRAKAQTEVMTHSASGSYADVPGISIQNEAEWFQVSAYIP